uniref:Uncharacterized protein n=1 Tax=Zea mays TaxID=4577 RepID=B4FCA5_MAIZE|nr:unknown [Zea mays]
MSGKVRGLFVLWRRMGFKFILSYATFRNFCSE